MGHSHLRHAAHQQQGHDGANQVADQHSRSCHADSESRSEEQTCSNSATDRNHGELTRRQPAPQAFLTIGYRIKR